MAKITICGGERLCGEVTVSGSKNSCLPILAATILIDEPCVIHNCPMISDADNMINILLHTGADVVRSKNTVNINCETVSKYEMPKSFSREIRSSIFMLGPVVSRFKKAKFLYPGGCEIGLRPIDLHLRGLRELNIKITEERGEIICETDEIIGADISLDYPSVGATENIIMAAVLAKGDTTIRNAAREPEIVELSRFLNACGAMISGEGSSTIVIKGVRKLHGVEFRCISDRIVSGTYMLMAAMTRGDVVIHDACVMQLHSLISKLRESGATLDISGDSVRVRADRRLKELHLIETSPYPGFPTDLQAQMCACASTASGTSIILENVFENRFKHIGELIRLGANITVKKNVAIIRGTEALYGAEVNATDLRAGAALALAGLCARGTTVIENAQLIDRGYENIQETVKKLGGKITKKEEREDFAEDDEG